MNCQRTSGHRSSGSASGAPMCNTLRCGLRAVFVLVWDDGYPNEPICSGCADSYARRPAVMAHAVIEPIRSY